MIKKYHYFVFVFMIIFQTMVRADDVRGSPVQLGQTINSVKEILNISIDPEERRSPFCLLDCQVTWALSANTKGIHMVFNAHEKLTQIMFAKPFHGEINGVRIGDSVELMKGRLGDPVDVEEIKFRGEIFEVFNIYYPDDGTAIKYLDKNGVISKIIISK